MPANVDAGVWREREPGATHKWIEGHIDELLATLERLWAEAACGPMAREFLDRMAWLPELLKNLDQPVPLDA